MLIDIHSEDWRVYLDLLEAVHLRSLHGSPMEEVAASLDFIKSRGWTMDEVVAALDASPNYIQRCAQKDNS